MAFITSFENLCACKAPNQTPWSEDSDLQIPDYPVYGDLVTILGNPALDRFRTTLNKLNLPFQYDIATAFFKYSQFKFYYYELSEKK
jgi:hypothetical protein